MFWEQRKTKSQSLPCALPLIKLSGFRVMLRPPQKSDFQEWTEVRRRNETYLKPYEPRWATNAHSNDFYTRRLHRQIRDWHQERAQCFLIFDKKSEALIGGININNIIRGAAQFASLGYWIDETHQGQGMMAEALRLIITYCFEELSLDRINAACLPVNERSKNLLLKAGFKEEGFAKKYLQIDGRRQDHVLFGLWKD